MSNNQAPGLWRVDTENVTVVAVTGPAVDTDATVPRIHLYRTHFESERGAWDALGEQVTAAVIAAGRLSAEAEAAAATTSYVLPERRAWLDAVQRDWQYLAAAAARNYALYQERRQAWNHQVDQALAAAAPKPEPAPAPAPQTFQRGDVVEVTFTSGFSYRGIVRSVRHGEVYVLTRGSGHSYSPADTQLTLVERRGRRNAATLHEWAQAFE